jgi:hypothetical protein
VSSSTTRIDPGTERCDAETSGYSPDSYIAMENAATLR